MSLFEPRTAVVTIYPGDYLDRIRHLEQRAEAELKSHEGVPLLNGEVPEYLATAKEHDALVAEANKVAVRIRLKHLPRGEWTALCELHPPREGYPADVRFGANIAEVAEKVVPLSIVEPEGITAEDLASLSHADWERLYLTAFALNRVPVADPKASLVSRMIQTNDETSS